MRVLRSRLLWLAAMTLTVQVAGLAIAPAALCCLSKSPKAQAANMQCCKDAGPGHICPLMKKKTLPEKPGGASLRSCCSPEDQVFTALLGFAGLLTPAVPALAAPSTTLTVPATTTDVVAWLAPVESPPPRA